MHHVPAAWHQRCTGGVYYPGYGDWVGGWEGNTGTPTQLLEEVLRQRSGPVSPCKGLEWWSQGRTYWDGPGPPCGPGRCTLVPLPVQDLANAASGPIRRDSTSFTVKLVRTRKCHRKVCMRPPIVPIPKTAPKSRLLKFLDFHILQPSLTRNY